MSNIEPTEEQWQAARDAYEDGYGDINVERVARLLAEREAKLRDQIDKLVANTVHRDWLEACSERDRAKAIAKQALDQRDTLRARVAELEAQVSDNVRLRVAAEERARSLQRLANDEVAACASHIESLESLLTKATADLEATRTRIAEWEVQHGIDRASITSMVESIKRYHERETQHLADIKALRGMLQEARHVVEAHVPASGDEVDDESGVCEVSTLEAIDEELERTDHYDDAKADAGAVCTHSARVWNVIDQTMRCRVCDDAKAAEGGEG